ncbi:MAG TPA: hypothetical protein VHX60_07445 [Acidobacteriaceae bacterium]|jgi:hypothetical protein|nr:hypothetical protein [Acidobacteriaceae bacterium]
MSVVRALLAHIVDYAGLFAPASLDMERAVRNYYEYRHGEYDWMLGNFVVPATRLAEFAEAFDAVCAREDEKPWKLNVLCTGDDLRADVRLIDAMDLDRGSPEAYEAKALNATAANQILKVLLRGHSRYIEFAPEKAGTVLPVLTRYEARAKLRTGGVTAEAIPPAKTVIRFLQACKRHRVPFKGTAGLHHAMRGTRALTYDLGSPTAKLHGFLNLLLTAALVQMGAAEEAAVKTLLEEDPAAFRVDEEHEDAIEWHGNRLTVEQALQLRAELVIGFGSCSFMEPVEDLQAMRWL